MGVFMSSSCLIRSIHPGRGLRGSSDGRIPADRGSSDGKGPADRGVISIGTADRGVLSVGRAGLIVGDAEGMVACGLNRPHT